MVRLSHSGRSVPQIARHLGVSEKRVRHWIKTFLAAGFEALTDRPPVGRTSRLTPAICEAVRQELEKGDRTWTAPQLAEWFEQQFHVRVSAAHLRRFRRRWQPSWKRTARSVDHQQEPDEGGGEKKGGDALEEKGGRGWMNATPA